MTKRILRTPETSKQFDDMFDSAVNTKALRNKAIDKMDKFSPTLATENQV